MQAEASALSQVTHPVGQGSTLTMTSLTAQDPVSPKVEPKKTFKFALLWLNVIVKGTTTPVLARGEQITDEPAAF